MLAALEFSDGHPFLVGSPGRGHLMESAACDYEVRAKAFAGPPLMEQFAIAGRFLIQKYFQDCRSELETGHNGYFSNLTSMMTTRFAPKDHPFLRRVIVN